MADSLRVTELDFDTIKNNLKVFLKQQEEFTDYDFEGSGFNILLDVLAYNTHYNAYYLNMVANEAFLDTALLRDSAVSHAKMLGYVPFSKKSASASINLQVTSQTVTPGSLTIPRGFKFLSNQIDGKTYTFTLLNDVTVTKVGNNYFFENVKINEGQLTSFRFVQNVVTNPKQIFTIPDENIDTQTLVVSVSPSVSNTDIKLYQVVKDVSEAKADSEVFFLQEYRNGRYQIYFGDGVLGKSLNDGNLVTINYLSTSGFEANKANNFVAVGSLLDSNLEVLTDFIIDPVQAANGGSDRESVDKIKYNAPLQYISQNRLVTQKDYEIFIRNSYPNIDSITVWGGEEESSPIYGKVFVSLKPRKDYYVSETEKQRIIDEIINPKSIVAISTEFREPEFIFLKNQVSVQYDRNKTTLSEEALSLSIKNAIILFKNLYLDKFNSKFSVSKLQETIDAVDLNSIIGSSVLMRLEKRFTPILNTNYNYTLNFSIPLFQGTSFNKLSSTEFTVYDKDNVLRTVNIEEIPNSFTGISSIQILNPGTNYTTTPTVTITGDGFGAEAEAIIKNGKIDSIKITKPGIDYNRAIVTISGGGGFGGAATAIINTQIGQLRAVYFTETAERVVVINNLGTIDYLNGIIQLNDLRIIETKTSDGTVRINCGMQDSIVQSSKNVILTIDEEDTSSIIINLQKT
jgi:hypothetical protein